MQVIVEDIETHIPRPDDAQQGVHVGSIHIDLPAVLMHDPADLGDGRAPRPPVPDRRLRAGAIRLPEGQVPGRNCALHRARGSGNHPGYHRWSAGNHHLYLGVQQFQRDQRDAEVLRDYIKIHLFAPDRVNQQKLRLWRTWKDGTLRAFLSEQYAVVNNGWYLDLLARLIPGGLLSHWKGDADTIYGNILIPDTIRKESDSDYGGMLSVGNSEIGLRRISSMPSVFRAICMNGCIWEQEKGVEVDIRHRGKIDFAELAQLIGENLEAQIPLLPNGIAKVLNLRNFGFGDAPVQGLFAQLSLDYGLGKREIAGVQKTFWEEVAQVGPKDGKTAFGFMGAVTRYGQTLDAAGWVKYDTIGGALANMDQADWDKFTGRAKNLTAKQIEKRLGDVVPA